MTLYTKILRTRGVDELEVQGMVLQPKVTASIGENNAASTFTCRIQNNSGKNKTVFNLADQIEVWVGENPASPDIKIFNGFITLDKFEGKGSDTEYISITAKDYYARLQDKTIEPITFRNIETADIVRSIMGPITDITLNNVFDTGVLQPAITYLHNTVDESVASLARSTARIAYVDVNKDLHFEIKNGISSGVVLQSGINIIKDNFTEKRAGMANKIWVYGGRILTRAPTIEYIADGTGSVFIVPEVPSNTQVRVDGVLKKGDVFEVSSNPPSGVQYLVDTEALNIVFVSGTAAGNQVPASGGSVAITYDRSSIIAKFGDDDQSILDYGPIEDAIIDETILTTQQAESVRDAELAERKDPFKQGDIEVKGIEILQVGRTVDVIIPNQNINATYNILQIEYDLSPKALFTEQVQKVKVAKKVNDIVDTIKQLMLQLKSQGSQNIGVSTLLTVAKFASEQVNPLDFWYAKTRDINDNLYSSSNVNGILGTVPSGLLQPVLNSGAVGGFNTIIFSGGSF